MQPFNTNLFSLFVIPYSNIQPELEATYCSLTINAFGAETWTLRAEDQKHLGSLEMWCWRRMEKIS